MKPADDYNLQSSMSRVSSPSPAAASLSAGRLGVEQGSSWSKTLSGHLGKFPFEDYRCFLNELADSFWRILTGTTFRPDIPLRGIALTRCLWGTGSIYFPWAPNFTHVKSIDRNSFILLGRLR
ncbi:hypothetical protein S40293_11271 [Stachybotrys chartarum IBT 40293]|nr:hypothetical protein S40293_11271 [Stachybotrys chartarum IBT 40293]